MTPQAGMSGKTRRSFEFGPFRLDPLERQLLHDGSQIPLTAKVFDILLVLVENHGHLVEKDDLMRQVWPDSFVEENNLTVNISALRKILGQTPSGQPYIETIPKRGYRFVAGVHEIQKETAQVPADGNPGLAPSGAEATAATQQIFAPESKRVRLSAKKWIVPAVIVILLAGLAITFYYFKFSGAAGPGGGQRSIAVLPFKAVGTEGIDDLLGLGMADALITRLSEIPRMVIRPTGSVLKYNSSGQDILAVGRELMVDTVLDGTILKSGDRVRVTVRLINVADGSSLWTRTLDEKWTNVFALQDLMSDRVARPLALQLTGKEQVPPARRSTENPAAYQFYLKGLVFGEERTEEGLKKAIEYFEEAIKSDPTYAMAYEGLADSYLTLATYGVLPANEAYTSARAAASKALEIDDSLAEPYATLGMVTLYRDLNWPGAEKEFKQAIERKPDSATARQRYALGLMRMGHFEEAAVEIRKAEEYDPLSQVIGANVGQVLYYARRYDEAIEELRKKLQVRPGFWMVHRILGEAYLQKGMHAEAILEMNEAIRLGGGTPVLGELGYACAVSGNRDRAVTILRDLTDLSKKRYVSPFAIALVHIGLGDKDQAFAWLDKSVEEHSRWLVTVKIDPMLDSLRSDPRFTALLSKIGFTN